MSSALPESPILVRSVAKSASGNSWEAMGQTEDGKMRLEFD
jgi:hypothetical protein